MSRRLLLLLILVLGLAATGCRRWRPNTPVSVSSSDPNAALDAVVYTMRRHNWPIVEIDEERGFVRGLARLGRGEWSYSWGKAKRDENHILVQVYSSGRIDAWVEGSLVTEDGAKVHKRLAAERNEFISKLKQVLAGPKRGEEVPPRGEVKPFVSSNDSPPPPPPPMVPRPVY